MADTADLRSEGKRYYGNGKYARERRVALTAAGLCNYCGKVEVTNRKVCYTCSCEQTQAAKLSGFRTHLKSNGIDPESAAASLRALMKKSRTFDPVAAGLLTALVEAQYKNKP